MISSQGVKRATVLSGIGMGLLLGFIMGLSVSEVVKVIMAALTAIMGAFLGFDKRSFTGITTEEYEKEKEYTFFTSLRAGWFGLAVVAGILSGMFIRAHEVFTPSLEKSVKQWTDAGYEAEYARKMVAYQRLAINPSTGEAGPVTSITRTTSSNFFSEKQIKSLCEDTDPGQWQNNWAALKTGILDLKNPSLATLVESVGDNVATDEQKIKIVKLINMMFCNMKKQKTKLCSLTNDPALWSQQEIAKPLMTELATLTPEQQKAILQSLSTVVCILEKN